MALTMPELVELVLDHCNSQHKLYRICLINKTFSEAAIPHLYRSLIVGQGFTGRRAFRAETTSLGLSARYWSHEFTTSLVVRAPHIRELSLGFPQTQATVALLSAATRLVSLTLFLGKASEDLTGPSDNVTCDLLKAIPPGLEYLDLIVSPGDHDAATFRYLLDHVPASLAPSSLGLQGINDAKLAVVATERLGRRLVTYNMLGRNFDGKEPLPYPQCRDLFASLPKLTRLASSINIALDERTINLLPQSLQYCEWEPSSLDCFYTFLKALANPSFLPLLRGSPYVDTDYARDYAPVPQFATVSQAEDALRLAIAGLEARPHCQIVEGDFDAWEETILLFFPEHEEMESEID